MIHDLTDLESLLRQYDPEKVLVGPLLSLWTNASFRVFNIAGKGSKIHETIGLGFVEREIDAQQRRADIVAALESCFSEVQLFDSQLEMAQAADTLWANDETARFLAAVSRESKPRPTRDTGQDQNLVDPDKFNVPPDDLGLSDTDAFANPGTVAESGWNLEAVRNLPEDAAASKKYPIWALSGVVAYFALCFVVGFLIGTAVLTRSTTIRQTVNEAILLLFGNAAPSITAGDDPSQGTGGSVSPPQSSPSQTAKTHSSGAETVPLSIPQRSEVARAQVLVPPAGRTSP